MFTSFSSRHRVGEARASVIPTAAIVLVVALSGLPKVSPLDLTPDHSEASGPWEQLAGARCGAIAPPLYPGHEEEEVAHIRLLGAGFALGECKAACAAISGCSSVTFDSAAGECTTVEGICVDEPAPPSVSSFTRPALSDEWPHYEDMQCSSPADHQGMHTWAECKALCLANDDCTAITYYPHIFQADIHACYTIHRECIQAPSFYGGAIMVRPDTNATTGSWGGSQGRECAGASTELLETAATLKECHDSCSGSDTCLAYSFSQSSGQCRIASGSCQEGPAEDSDTVTFFKAWERLEDSCAMEQSKHESLSFMECKELCTSSVDCISLSYAPCMLGFGTCDGAETIAQRLLLLPVEGTLGTFKPPFVLSGQEKDAQDGTGAGETTTGTSTPEREGTAETTTNTPTAGGEGTAEGGNPNSAPDEDYTVAEAGPMAQGEDEMGEGGSPAAITTPPEVDDADAVNGTTGDRSVNLNAAGSPAVVSSAAGGSDLPIWGWLLIALTAALTLSVLIILIVAVAMWAHDKVKSSKTLETTTLMISLDEETAGLGAAGPSPARNMSAEISAPVSPARAGQPTSPTRFQPPGASSRAGVDPAI